MNIDQPSPQFAVGQQAIAITWLHVRLFQHGDSRGALAIEFLPFAYRAPSALWRVVWGFQLSKGANDA